MKYTRFFSVSFIITILILSTSLPYQVEAQKGGPDVIPGRYIVVLEDGVSPQDVTRGHGVVPDFVYSHALNGFSGNISPVSLEELKQDPRVLYIEQDQKMYAFDHDQTLPTGINRIDAEPSDSSNLGSAVTIAVIDTGIDLDHPDLNVVHSTNCSGGGPFGGNCGNGGDDDNGHGTHVAGTAAGVNNHIGVVGVAPGADLWAVKVLDKRGSGYMSWIVAGIDYVTANADVVNVANMSLGCECSSPALDDAITASVAAGVTYVVAAGNSDKDASTFSPANHPDVITVSALADSNGMCGGGGGNTSYGADDTLATFSNYGSDVEIAAPGVDIYSTLPGGYGTYSGTSMASPHVTGAAALIVADNPSFTPSDVLTTLLNNSVPQGQACNGDGDGGFSESTGDGSPEPLAYVGNSITPIADVTDPNISNVDSSFTSDSATITWDTDEPATSLVKYSTDHSYGPPVSNSNYVTSHSIELTGLSSSTPYHFMVTSVDGSTNSASSADTHFTTASPPALVSISVSPVNPSITEGSTQQFTITGTYSDLTNKVLTADSWESSDTTYGTVNADGLATGTTAGSTTIKAIYGSLEDTTTLTVTTAPEDPTSTGVFLIDYLTYGGKDGDKHLDIIITIIDNFDDPVSGASVSIELFRDDLPITSGTATTTTDGIVTFSLKNAASGFYKTDVTNVIAGGLTFVDDYVDDGFPK